MNPTLKRPRSRKIIVGVIAATAIAAVALSHTGRIGPVDLYPDAYFSPGLIATSDINELTAKSTCGTYSQCHRNTSSPMKSLVRSEYPNCPTGPGQSEIDHILPLALGGADDVKNLWCEPATSTWNGVDYGFHAKDALESYLAAKVKSGAIVPKDAQTCILQDWVACYNKYIKPNDTTTIPTDPDTKL